MNDDVLTLAELSERSGVEIRTLRSWMAQGVIPGAETVGRNARYAQEALTRARAVRAMREIYGMPLPEIRQELLTADAARIEAYAAMAAPAGADAAPAPFAEEVAPPSGTSAADYLRNLRKTGVLGAGAARGASFAPPPPPATPPGGAASLLLPSATASSPPPGSRLARLAEALERIARPRPSRRKTRGDVRVHIPITPDLELTVRGDHSPEEIARFEQIADLLRAILTGGADHD
jgi:DNA-binding transcriptional MerR regulator